MEDFTEPNNLKICIKVWEPSFSCRVLLVSGSVAPVEEEEEREPGQVSLCEVPGDGFEMLS